MHGTRWRHAGTSPGTCTLVVGAVVTDRCGSGCLVYRKQQKQQKDNLGANPLPVSPAILPVSVGTTVAHLYHHQLLEEPAGLVPLLFRPPLELPRITRKGGLASG